MILAGETSGDHYGAGLAAALLRDDPSLSVFGMGGEEMVHAGVEVIQDIRGLDVMGFWDVLTKIRTFKRIFRSLVDVMNSRKPDCIVLIDYPGFNIRFAREAKKAGIRVVYFISPKVWAWKAGRITKLAEYCDKMLVFFDFEIEVYRNSGLETVCIGHPLAAELESYRNQGKKSRAVLGIPEDVRLVGLLPGSRKREVKKMFPVMLNAAALLAEDMNNVYFAAGCASMIPPEYLKTFLRKKHPAVRMFKGKTRDIMAASDMLMITSGTATLEAGIIGTPHVLCYSVGFLTYFLVKPLIKIENVGIVNIASGKKIMPELIQFDMTPERIVEEIDRFLVDHEYFRRSKQELKNLYRSLRKEGDAYDKAVREISALIPD